MKFSEWLKPDTVALLHTAIYYGIPKYGHDTCYRQATPPIEQVTIEEPDVAMKYCSGCGKPLLKEKPVDKALRITALQAPLQQNEKSLTTEAFIKANMWKSINSWWLDELADNNSEPGKIKMYLRLPATYQWGHIARTTEKFLIRWLYQGLVLKYEEVAIEEDGSIQVQNVYEPKLGVGSSTIRM